MGVGSSMHNCTSEGDLKAKFLTSDVAENDESDK